MKKVLFAIGLLAALSVCGQSKGVNVLSFSPNAMILTQGDAVTITVKCFENTVAFTVADTFRVQIQHVNNDQTVYGLIEIYKIAVKDIMALSKNKDGSTSLFFSIPADFITGNSQLIYNYYDIRPTAFVSSKTTTDITAPIEADQKFTYYNIQGLAITRPDEGFFIWKSENGVSGKGYAVK